MERRTSTKLSLSSDAQRLVGQMQRLNFGSIENLHIVRGQPFLEPPPRIVREFKFPGQNGPRSEASLPDFSLKSEVQELMAALAAVGTGVIERIEVRHGLPFRMVVTEPLSL